MIEYYYDTFGRSTGYAINGVRQTTIDYDSFGRISTMTVPATENGENVHSPTPTQSSNSFHWTYLQGSDLKASLAYPNGLTASWTYDANNQLLQVKNTYPSDGLGRDGSPLPSAGVISQFDYTYDAAGRRTAIMRSGSAFGDLSGSVDTYTYNARSELTSARRTKNGQPIPGFSEDFDYDPIGNRRSSATYNEKGEAQTSTYQANNLNQYTSRTTPGYAAVRGEAAPEATVTVNENPAFRLGSYYFGSDLFDNSTAGGLANLETYATLGQFAANGEEADDLVSAATNQVYLAQSPETFAYDDDGNQTLVTTKTGLWRVTYNGENRPILWENLAAESDNQTISNQTILAMSYDHMGRRREKNAQRFFYDGYLQVADNTGNSYIWDCTETMATRPLACSRGDSSSCYFHDGNKNVSEFIASSGDIAAHYDYAPFGAIIAQSDMPAAMNPWRFSSEYFEVDTATIYYNCRHYEPDRGSWLNRDVMGEAGGMNLYVNCKNQMLASSDFLGKSSDGCCCVNEVGVAIEKTLQKVERDFNRIREENVLDALVKCNPIYLAGAWDILFPDNKCKSNDKCKEMVSVNGNLYNKWDVNYILFGRITSLCDICAAQMHAMIAAHKIVNKPIVQLLDHIFGDGDDEFEFEWKYSLHQWARIGRNFTGELPAQIPDSEGSNKSNCKVCEEIENEMPTTWP